MSENSRQSPDDSADAGKNADQDADLSADMRFILEVDNLKHVQRRARLLTDPPRLENTAEHSWHVALMAVVLSGYANQPVDLLRTLKMLLVHDIVEIDAGDTFAYGDQSSKAAREEAAAERIFGILPAQQRGEFVSLWHEFDAATTAEARFANAVDRLMPALHNYFGVQGTWKEHGIRYDQALVRLRPIDNGSHALWEYLSPLIEDALARGDLLP